MVLSYHVALHTIIYDEEVSHTVHVTATLFDSNASSFNEEENIEEPFFFVR